MSKQFAILKDFEGRDIAINLSQVSLIDDKEETLVELPNGSRFSLKMPIRKAIDFLENGGLRAGN